MDAFTQRMLERARARQEKIDQKLISSGLSESRRKPLAENVNLSKSPAHSPCKVSNDIVLSKKSTRDSLTPKKVSSPRRVSQEKPDSPLKIKRSIQKPDSVSSPQRRNDVIVTRKEFNSPRKLNRRNSDVSVEINIMHSDDIQIEVQVEEREVPVNVVYDTDSESGVTVKEIKDTQKTVRAIMDESDKVEKPAMRGNMKSRLDRLGNLYSDKPTLSSPIHRTEADFTAGTPPAQPQPREKLGKKFGRLAALADQINNWEDDLTQHTTTVPDNNKKPSKASKDKLEASTLDVSIHSIQDINKVMSRAGAAKSTNKVTKQTSSATFTRSANECQRLRRQVVAELIQENGRFSTQRHGTGGGACVLTVAVAGVVENEPYIFIHFSGAVAGAGAVPVQWKNAL